MTHRLIGFLDEHPNSTEIAGVVSRLPHIADDDLPGLAAAWRNSVFVAEARARALQPDSPLIFDVLSAFDAVQDLWGDELAGLTDLDAAMVSTALKAVRDGIAAAYARPVLSRGAYSALFRPWRSVYAADESNDLDLGWRSGDVKALLNRLPWLATRCHDHQAAERYDGIAAMRWSDESDRLAARDQAWNAAVLTGRQRVWGLLRRNGAEELSRPCSLCCRRPIEDAEMSSVITMCQDAACALLVADVLPASQLDVLVRPVRQLIPQQRPPVS